MGMHPHPDRDYEWNELMDIAHRAEVRAVEAQLNACKTTLCVECGEPIGYSGASLRGYITVPLCGQHMARYWRGSDPQFRNKIDNMLTKPNYKGANNE